MSAEPVVPVALDYDDLPAGSDIRREYGADGAVTITAPAGEPSPADRRAAVHATGLWSAGMCGVGLLFALWIGARLVPTFNRLDLGLRVAAVVLFGVFAGGVFLLAWRVWYGARLELLAELRSEAVVFHVSPQRLLIEAAGPRGARSFELPAAEVVGVSVAEEGPTAHLSIMRAGGGPIVLLPGRHPAELRWVAAMLSHVLNLRR